MKTYSFTGEEALAWGAWEAGVRVASGYPGSPSTRFLEHLAETSRPDEVYAEWSANEKVAAEIALGASLGGKRAVVAMKSVGLNVAMDPIMVANLGGVIGGLVILLGDDPGAWGSQNEQDGRLLAQAADLPLLEFSSPQEAYDMVSYAFSLSERYELPVFIRETRSSAGEKGPVQVKETRLESALTPFWRLENWRFFPIQPAEKHKNLYFKISQIASEFGRSPFNRIFHNSSRGILGAGYAAAKVSRILQGSRGEELSFFKLGTVYPFPDEELIRFLSPLEAVLVVEELRPLIENHLRALAHRHNLKTRIYGKETGHLPREGEIFPKHLLEGMKESLEARNFPRDTAEQEGFPGIGWTSKTLPPECPYHQAFQAFRSVLPRDPEQKPIFVGDDGCLMMLKNPPFSLLGCKFCMGSSIGIATGLARAGEKRKIVALIGDSSFFHTGLPAYMNAAASGVRIMVVVLDNRCTAMTGCQGNPGTEFNLQGRKQEMISLESVLKSAGVKFFRQVDAFGDPRLLAEAFRGCLESEQFSVLLVIGPCPNLTRKTC
jgi:indolepyruvate ferredoxin oxidoreductase alpha subunit